MNLVTDYMGLQLKNPVVIAAGPWSRDAASIQRSIDAGAAAVVTETITMEANNNPSPRLYLSNTDQLFNTTLYSELYLEQWESIFETLNRGDCKIIASIWAASPSELSYLATKMERMGADAIEVSLSAPLGTRAQMVSSYPQEIYDYIHAVTEAVDIPVSIKLSYESVNASRFIQMLEKVGIGGVVAIDSLKGLMGIDLEKRCAMMPTYGGYSGEQIRPIALATTATLKQLTDFPICGCGGIYRGENALEFIMLGAQCIQLASILLREGYEAIPRILGEMNEWLERHNCTDLQEIRGAALRSLQPFEDLPPRPLIAHINDRCTGCGKCISGCLYGALRMENGTLAVDGKKCSGCGFCAASCRECGIHLGW